MRIALFSEVYWPMVSGVGVTLLRLTEALQERGHQVRVYSASYGLAEGESDRPEVHRSPSVPLFLYPDVQWAFPRIRDVEDRRAVPLVLAGDGIELRLLVPVALVVADIDPAAVGRV